MPSLSAALVVLGLSVARLPAAGDLPLDRLVPATTPAFLTFPHPGASAAAFQELPVYKTWADPEVQEFLKSARTAAPRLLAERSGGTVSRLYELLGDFPAIFDLEISIAWLDRRKATERWVAIAEGTDEARVRERARAIEKDVIAPLFDAAPAVSSRGGTEIRTYRAGKLELAIAARGSRVLLGSPRVALEELLDAHDVPPAASLAADASYRALRERLGADGGEMFFAAIDLGGIVRAGMEAATPRNRRTAEAAGLTSLGRAGASIRAEGALLRERISLEFPEGRRGLFAAISENSNAAGVAKLAPVESLGVVALNLKLRDLYATLLEIEKASEGEVGVGAGALEAAVSSELKLRVLGDFVELLGEEVGAYVSIPAGGSVIPEAGLFVEVRDPERFQANVQELCRKTLKLSFNSIDFRGRKVHYVQSGGRNDFGVTFSYAVADPFLVVSYHPSNVKNALSRLDKASSTLASDPEFVATLATLPPDRKGFGYVDTKRTVAYLYNLFSFVMQMDMMRDLPFDPAALPTVEALTRHLRRTTGVLSAERTALVADVRSEGIGPASAFMYSALAGGLFSPLLVASSVRAADNDCQYALHSLMWRAQTDPEGVVVGLRKAFAERPEGIQFRCPADATTPESGTSYVLVYPGDTDRPPDLPPSEVIVLHERAALHQGRRHVLRLDCTVERLDDAEFARRIARQAEAAAPQSK